ncbi:MAG: arginine--tRNA ligase [Bacillales bacterium]|nr:arginine--tRNA ligase [Bacillales bacterium]
MLDVESKLKLAIKDSLSKLGCDVDLNTIVIEHSKDKAHGDYATTVAMQMARVLHKSPRDIANEIINNISKDGIDKIEIAGPGFINFFMNSNSLTAVIKTIVDQGDDYGNSKEKHEGKINVEFVSANPTGDLHLGHARGAAIGDVICRLYKKAGYDVTREYYVNDAGNQIHNLALSLKARYLQALGQNVELPENGYHGGDLINLAKDIIADKGDSLIEDNEANYNFFREVGTKLELDKIIRDLTDFRVEFDIFSSELAIRNAGKVEYILDKLKPWIYFDQGATFLKTTSFSDDKDRVLIKSDGAYTYLLPDIAYHKDKLDRGFTTLIDCLGADHHGYIERMRSSLVMLGYPGDCFNVELIQMVRLFKDGKEFKMSKRTGNAVSMKELCEEVGVDAVRYFFVSRAASGHLDFDLDLAHKMDSTNPVYYAQYAHARLCTVLEKAKGMRIDFDGSLLNNEKEFSLLKVLADFPKEITQAAEARAPFKITNYIQKLATSIHEFYSECRVLDDANVDLTASRLGLCKAAQIVLKNALDTIGVNAPEKM